jgi:hypothetical protein|tara:strand:- start:221 stop:379 length:159 start_codon:yes stop_codon:yes gene_type:complete
MKVEKKKINVDYSDFEYWVKFEKYIREYKSEIYEDAYQWAMDKKNTIYENRK